jgi:hypothetical protein
LGSSTESFRRRNNDTSTLVNSPVPQQPIVGDLPAFTGTKVTHAASIFFSLVTADMVVINDIIMRSSKNSDSWTSISKD